jgi:ubiquitin-like protein ATG12
LKRDTKASCPSDQRKRHITLFFAMSDSAQPAASGEMMKKTKFLIGANQPFSSVISFLRKMLKMGNESSLFLYCNSAFAPGPDECVGDLRDCFNIRGELVINYSLQVSHV